MAQTDPLVIAGNLALDQAVAARRAAGEAVLHLGFGEAGLPILPRLGEVLAEHAGRNAYGPVAGDEEVRASVAGYFARRRLPTDPDQIVMAPGSKPLLAALVASIPGEVVLPAPSWVTYGPQAALFGRTVRWVPVPETSGGIPEPGQLDVGLRSRPPGDGPGLVILTSPDNPTGSVAPPALVREVCAVAHGHGLVVIADEIYRDVIFDPSAPYLSAAEVLPDRVVVTTGLSKSMALGGWRIGAARFPATRWGDDVRARVTGAASNIWSNLAGPMQAVAATVFSEPDDVIAYRARATRLHGLVVRAAHEILLARGLECRAPAGGFYVYPGFGVLRERLDKLGATDDRSLARVLLQQSGVATMPGSAFGDDPSALRLRMATSLLYGDSDAERWAAFRADDPVTVPHVAAALTRLDDTLGRLSRAR